jgi:hypothetical protein
LVTVPLVTVPFKFTPSVPQVFQLIPSNSLNTIAIVTSTLLKTIETKKRFVSMFFTKFNEPPKVLLKFMASKLFNLSQTINFYQQNSLIALEIQVLSPSRSLFYLPISPQSH